MSIDRLKPAFILADGENEKQAELLVETGIKPILKPETNIIVGMDVGGKNQPELNRRSVTFSPITQSLPPNTHLKNTPPEKIKKNRRGREIVLPARYRV